MDVALIDDMPNLAKRLGKSKCDRIRYYQRGRGKRQPCATNVENLVMDAMQYKEPFDIGCPVIDAITGVANSVDTNSKPLNVNRLYNILKCIPIVNTQEVQAMLNVGDQQARKYVKAVKLVMPFLNKHLNEKPNNESIH